MCRKGESVAELIHIRQYKFVFHWTNESDYGDKDTQDLDFHPAILKLRSPIFSEANRNVSTYQKKEKSS